MVCSADLSHPLPEVTPPLEPRDQEKLRKLRKVSEQFEAILVGSMLHAMRETIPEGGLISRGIEMDIFENLFDEEISERISSRHQMGFADLIFRQLAGKLNLGVPLQDILKQARQLQRKVRELESPVFPSGSDSGSSHLIAPYEPIIQKAAQKYDLDPNLIKAVILQESNGDPNAVSSKGAKGLMQLIDSTAEMMGVGDVFDPQENIMGGARYLKVLLDQFDNDIELALASYNAGPGNVARYGGIPPFQETIDYVRKIIQNYRNMGSPEGVGQKRKA